MSMCGTSAVVLVNDQAELPICNYTLVLRWHFTTNFTAHEKIASQLASQVCVPNPGFCRPRKIDRREEVLTWNNPEILAFWEIDFWWLLSRRQKCKKRFLCLSLKALHSSSQCTSFLGVGQLILWAWKSISCGTVVWFNVLMRGSPALLKSSEERRLLCSSWNESIKHDGFLALRRQ